MLWARIEVGGRVIGGAVEGAALAVFDREPYLGGRPTGESVPLEGARWLTPCAPGKFIALWNNFHEAAAKNGWSVPTTPLYFLKAPNAHNAHLQPVPIPADVGRVVYEGELGIVIGQTCRAVTPQAAAERIFGFTCVNDVTALELLNSDPSFPQWTRAKGLDGFGVFGPVIATDVAPHALVVRTLVNGRVRQEYPIADAIFAPAELVSRISQDMTLEPGDLIACGTSLGVAPVRPDMVVEVAIDGVGVLQNTFEASGSAA